MVVSGQDLYVAKLDAMQDAREARELMVPLGIKLAEKERSYRMHKRQRIHYEREHSKTPATLVVEMVNGYEDVSALRYARDVAKVEYDANYERLLLAKKEIDSLTQMIAKEAGQ